MNKCEDCEHYILDERYDAGLCTNSKVNVYEFRRPIHSPRFEPNFGCIFFESSEEEVELFDETQKKTNKKTITKSN